MIIKTEAAVDEQAYTDGIAPGRALKYQHSNMTYSTMVHCCDQWLIKTMRNILLPTRTFRIVKTFKQNSSQDEFSLLTHIFHNFVG